MQRSASILVITAVGLAVALATPAVAKPRHQTAAGPQGQYNQLAAPAHNPNCVYRGGNLIGCDPDPNVRQQLENTSYRYGPT